MAVFTGGFCEETKREIDDKLGEVHNCPSLPWHHLSHVKTCPEVCGG